MTKMGQVDSLQENPGMNPAETVTDRRETSPSAGKKEYQKRQTGVQCDITRRKYEIAAWLQDVNGLEEDFLTEEEWLVLEQEEEEKPWEEDEDAFEEAENSLNELERMLERLRENQKRWKEKKGQTKKKLGYSYRRVSTAIQGAKTLTQASTALASANSNLSSIRRKAVSGQYSEKEIAMAKTHALKMVRTARRKVRNIKLEAGQVQKNKHTKSKENRRVKQVQEQVQHQRLEQKLLRLKKQLKSEENQTKYKHRRRENWELMQADMEYLRRYIDYLRNREEEMALNTELQSVAPVESTVTGDGTEATEMLQGTQEAQAQMDAVQAEAAVGAGQGVDVMV